MNRKHIARISIWFTMVLLASVSSIMAQPIDLAIQQKVDIPLTAGVVHPSPSGRFVLCAQFETFENSDQQNQPIVRLVVVDLKSSKVLAMADFPAGSYRFAASEEYAFVAKNDEMKLDILRLSDLTLQSTIPLTSAVDEFLIANERILFSKDGSIRLDLKTLRRSEEWSSQETPLPVRHYYDGWLIDGVLWSEDLTMPKMICVIEFLDGAADSDADFRSNTPWLQKKVNPFNSDEYPMMATFQTDQEGKRVFSIYDLEGNELAKCIAGQRTTNVGNLSVMKLTSYAAGSGIEYFAFRGKKGMSICDKQLQVWDLGSIDDSKLQTPLLAQRVQNTWTAPFGEPTVLTHFANQEYSGDFQMTSDKIEATTNTTGVCTFDLQHWVTIVRKQNVDDYIARRASLDLNLKVPGLVKRLKLDPNFSYFADPIRVALKNEEGKKLNSRIRYYILTSIPKKRVQEACEASLAKQERRLAADHEESKRQAEQDALLAAQKIREEEAFKVRANVSFYTRLAISGVLILGVSLGICAPFWFWGRSDNRRQRKLAAFSMSIVGTLPLIGCAYWYAAFVTRLSEGNRVDSVTSANFLLLSITASLLFVCSLITIVRTLLRRSAVTIR